MIFSHENDWREINAFKAFCSHNDKVENEGLRVINKGKSSYNFFEGLWERKNEDVRIVKCQESHREREDEDALGKMNKKAKDFKQKWKKVSKKMSERERKCLNSHRSKSSQKSMWMRKAFWEREKREGFATISNRTCSHFLLMFDWHEMVNFSFKEREKDAKRCSNMPEVFARFIRERKKRKNCWEKKIS